MQSSSVSQTFTSVPNIGATRPTSTLQEGRLVSTQNRPSYRPTGNTLFQNPPRYEDLGSAAFIVVSKKASSLYSLIADGQYRPTELGRYMWKTLIGSQASLQLNCTHVTRRGSTRRGDNGHKHIKAMGYILVQRQSVIRGTEVCIPFRKGHSEINNYVNPSITQMILV